MPLLGRSPTQPRCDFQENWKKQDKGKYKSAYEEALEAAGVEGSDEGFEQFYGVASGGSPRVNTPAPRPPDHSVDPILPPPPDSTEPTEWVKTRPTEVPESVPSWKVRREAREEREREALDERVREAGKRNKHRKNAPTEWEATAGQERTAVMGILGGRKR